MMAGALVCLAVVFAFIAWLAHGWLKELLAVFEEAKTVEQIDVSAAAPAKPQIVLVRCGGFAIPDDDEELLVNVQPRGRG